MLKVCISWVLVLACMGLIFYFGSLPGSDVPSLFPYQDIVFHFTIYLILGAFFSRAMNFTNPHLKLRRIILISALFVFFYGLSDELHQLFVPGRSCAFSDALTDGLGGLSGSLLLLRCLK